MDKSASTVIVEFYGLPRRQAGQSELTVAAGSVREVLQATVHACPNLAELFDGDHLARRYLVSLDGKRFITNLNESLSAGTRLLILGADAGG